MHKFKVVLVILFFNNILFANIENVKSNKKSAETEQLSTVSIEKTFKQKTQESIKSSLSLKKLPLLFTNKKVLKTYYKNFDYQLFWLDEKGIKDIALDLLETIKNDPVLKPHSNNAFKLEKIIKTLNSLETDPEKYFESMTKIDFMLTEVYDRYMKYLSTGAINWKIFQKQLKELDEKDEIIADWEKYNVNKNMSELLIKAINKNDLSLAFNEVNYTFPKAKELSKALDELEIIASNGGYTKLPKFKSLRIGDKSDIIKTLRKRLLESKDLNQTCENIVMAENLITNNIQNQDELNLTPKAQEKTITETSTSISEQNDCEKIFDEDLKQAVISFQKNHGLVADGIVGFTTRKNLNISVENKISKIRLNLERMRWLPRALGDKYLMVNIPDYKLQMYEKGNLKLDMAVVVGEKRHPTPIFSDKVSFIVLNPYWKIPPRIVEREIIPKLIANPNYLNEKGIKVHPNWDHKSEALASETIDWNMYNLEKTEVTPNIEQDLENGEYTPAAIDISTLRLIQVPSDQNPLGRIKFIFPNKYSVYMHDTPSKSLFNRTYRAFSHGCIRLAHPKELLKAIASEDNSVDYDKANEILKEIEKTTMGLNQKIPVHIVYLTSWIDENGILQFRDDIYNYDNMQKKLLF